MIAGVGHDGCRCWCGSDGLGTSRDGSGGSNDLIVLIIVVLIRHWEEGLFVAINGFAPEFQMPVNKGTIVLVNLGVFDDNSPSSNTRFAPWEISFV